MTQDGDRDARGREPEQGPRRLGRPSAGVRRRVDGDDGNSGHGNEFCQFLDWENPSGQNQHGGTQSGYILRTYDELSRL